MNKLKFLALGFIFGVILIKAEVISWFRIQEMFRFQAFQMYGIIGSAVVIGIISVFLIKKYNIKTIKGEEIKIEPKKFSIGNIIGGLMFGLGWAMTGACPGPLYALIGSGLLIIVVVLLSAVFGTWVYGCLRNKFPH
ncbi:MAG TPA: DUF6691 family protein [Bacteroidia bacterium]|nr:DUF6691 family protein [Bacteroidia bacterium]